MANSTTYSFQDVSVVISHPSVGQQIITGAGAKSVTVTTANDITSHDVAADGSVMINKLPSPNGAVAFVAQQTSDAHQYFTKLYNYLQTAPTDEFALTTIVINAPMMKIRHTATGCSPQKRADKPYAAAGQDVTWNFMAAFINEEVI